MGGGTPLYKRYSYVAPIGTGVFVDCSQSPIFPCDRRDRARLTVNGGHLDFQSYRV